jgi:CubicO group peptidase (beta-lactamase class C family)
VRALRLDQLLHEHVSEWPVDRAAAAVVTRDGVVGSHGDLDDRFALASVTKPITALAVLVAVEEETTSLDEPAGPNGSTVAHLLAHASGLSPDDPSSRLAAPGTKRIYSNAGYDVLGDHVAQRAAMAFGDYARHAVLDPLGLGLTIDGSPAKDGVGSVADLTDVVAELMAPTLLAPATVQRATTVAFPGLDGVVPGFGRQSPADWGLGFELRGHKQPHWTGAENSPATFGHFGRCGCFFWIDPVGEVGLVAFTDREFDAWARSRWTALADAVLGAVT